MQLLRDNLTVSRDCFVLIIFYKSAICVNRYVYFTPWHFVSLVCSYGLLMPHQTRRDKDKAKFEYC